MSYDYNALLQQIQELEEEKQLLIEKAQQSSRLSQKMLKTAKVFVQQPGLAEYVDNCEKFVGKPIVYYTTAELAEEAGFRLDKTLTQMLGRELASKYRGFYKRDPEEIDGAKVYPLSMKTIAYNFIKRYA